MRLNKSLQSCAFKIAPVYGTQGFARLAAGACVIAIVILSVVPYSVRPETGMPKELEHFTAYAGAGLFLSLALPSLPQRLTGWIVLATASGVLEFAQKMAPGRTPSFLDAFASAGGLTAGMIAGVCFAALIAARAASTTD